MKWIRRLLVLSLVLVLLGAIASLLGYRMLRGRPEWYRPGEKTDAQAAADAADRLQEKVTFAANWTARAQNAQAHPDAVKSTPGAPAANGVEPLELTLTEPEIQAYGDRWDEHFHWKQQYGRYVVNPQFAIYDQNVVFAATLPDLADLVVSAHFHLEIDAQGKLRLRLVKVLGGHLPLPRVLWSQYRSKLREAISDRLPAAQDDAKLKSDGSANDAMVEVVLEKLLLHAMEAQPADPVLFLPYMQNYREHNLPVTVTRAVVDDHAKSLTLTFEPLGTAERAALIASVKEPYRTPAVDP